MRDVYGKRGTSILTWITSALIAGFLTEELVSQILQNHVLTQTVAFSGSSVRQGLVWTFFSYCLVHGTGMWGIWSLAIDVLGLYFLGRELLTLLGKNRFLLFYLGSLLVGAMAWIGFHYKTADVLHGASPALAGMMVMYALFYPDQEITSWMFFFPITVKPKYLAWTFAAVCMTAFVCSEMIGKPVPMALNFAPSAQLGGMLTALLFYRFIHLRTSWDGGSQPAVELPRWLRKTPKQAVEVPTGDRINLSTRDSVRVEVDRILDKINSHGFAALTAEEKRILDEAKDLLSRH